MKHLKSCWIKLCIYLFCLGLPSTLSSDAHVQKDDLSKTSLDEEYSADKQKENSTETPPHLKYPYEQRFQMRKSYQKQTPEKRDVFNNKTPNNEIPRNSLPHNALPHNALPHNALPHNALPRNALPSNSLHRNFPKQKIERRPLKSNQLPKNKIPRNQRYRNRIPRN